MLVLLKINGTLQRKNHSCYNRQKQIKKCKKEVTTLLQ